MSGVLGSLWRGVAVAALSVLIGMPLPPAFAQEQCTDNPAACGRSDVDRDRDRGRDRARDATRDGGSSRVERQGRTPDPSRRDRDRDRDRDRRPPLIIPPGQGNRPPPDRRPSAERPRPDRPDRPRPDRPRRERPDRPPPGWANRPPPDRPPPGWGNRPPPDRPPPGWNGRWPPDRPPPGWGDRPRPDRPPPGWNNGRWPPGYERRPRRYSDSSPVWTGLLAGLMTIPFNPWPSQPSYTPRYGYAWDGSELPRNAPELGDTARGAPPFQQATRSRLPKPPRGYHYRLLKGWVVMVDDQSQRVAQIMTSYDRMRGG